MDSEKNNQEILLDLYKKMISSWKNLLNGSLEQWERNLFTYAINSAEQDIGRILLSGILIQYSRPIDEIVKIYKEYGIIVLANDEELKGQYLLIGCGKNYYDHNHKDYVTINMEISMSPHIVGQFLFCLGIPKFISGLGIKYSTICTECCTILVAEDLEPILNQGVPKFTIDTMFLKNPTYIDILWDCEKRTEIPINITKNILESEIVVNMI